MGRKIKWKDFEGEPEDIAKFLQMTNVDVKDFMPNPMNRRVINIILVVLIMVVFVLLLVHHFVNESGQSVISFISSFLLFIEIFFRSLTLEYTFADSSSCNHCFFYLYCWGWNFRPRECIE